MWCHHIFYSLQPSGHTDGVSAVCLVSCVTELLVLSDALLLVAGDAVGGVVVAGVAVTQVITGHVGQLIIIPLCSPVPPLYSLRHLIQHLEELSWRQGGQGAIKGVGAEGHQWKTDIILWEKEMLQSLLCLEMGVDVVLLLEFGADSWLSY